MAFAINPRSYTTSVDSIWWQQEFGYGFDSFTESEARYLIKSRQDADTIRTRVLAARQAPGE